MDTSTRRRPGCDDDRERRSRVSSHQRFEACRVGENTWTSVEAAADDRKCGGFSDYGRPTHPFYLQSHRGYGERPDRSSRARN